MLRRAENVTVQHKNDLISLFMGGKSYTIVTIAKNTYTLKGRRTGAQLAQFEAASTNTPMQLVRIGERQYWLYQGRYYWDNDGYKTADVKALLDARERSRNDTLNRAKTLTAVLESPTVTRRGIAPDVKQLVWHRDHGACRQCGSQHELQYDHIIPVSMGGGNDQNNLQILCGPCNRRKGASIV